MHWSRFFIPTAKETPADATAASHQLGLRAGLFRPATTGSYTYLPLGLRVIRRIETIIREELNGLGAVELHMPALQPMSWWEESGRAETLDDLLLRIKGDGWRAAVCLGPTHEEAVTDLARACLSSYRQLPATFYQIQTKFRGEEKIRSGILRLREFLMQDAYTFDLDKARLDVSYQRMYQAYCRIFTRCGLPFMVVEAESGPMGGEASHEFMVLSEAGEDVIALSEDGAYAANMERAARGVQELPADPPAAAMAPLTEVKTPNCATIEDVCRFLQIAPTRMIKTLVYQLGPAQAGPSPTRVVACVRGDHQVNEHKLRRVCREAGMEGEPVLCDVHAAAADGFSIGYVGPQAAGHPACRLLIDFDARALADAVTGANRLEHHVTGFNWARDLPAETLSRAVVADLRFVVEGDAAPAPPALPGSRLRLVRGIEVGHVFKLGTRYSHPLKAAVLDANGRPQELVMGCYGIGLDRVLAAAIEAHHDADGIRWPMSIAPFEVLIVAVDARDDAVLVAAGELHDALHARGIEVLLDNRDERAGFKFKDADLIGIPLRITVGRKALAEGQIELKARSSREVERLSLDAGVEEVAGRVLAGRSS